MESKPEAPSTEQDLVTTAEGAIVAIIVNILKSNSKSKFAEAAKACSLGQSLMRLRATRVEDFAVLEPNENEEGINVAPRNRYMMANNGPADEREVQRNFMLTFGNNAQVHAEAQRAAVATQEATELQTLLALQATVTGPRSAAVEARVAALFEHMESRNHASKPEPVVADTDVPRGHPAGEGGAQEDAVEGVLPDGGRREGNGVVAFACRIPPDAQEAVGQAG
jgi:hypothetical protein